MTLTPPVPDDMTELVNASIDRVDLVGSAANGTRFLIAKGAGLVDAGTVRDLVAKADKAPDAGSETTPGTPAWEAVDAAAAQQWLSVLVRAKNALCALSDREAAEGGDDWGSSMDLSDAATAVAYAVKVLAEFAANEAYDADPPADVLSVAKSVDPADLAALESITPLVKAGRALSAANEKALRDAAAKIQNVLNSLPQPAPDNANLLKETTAMAEENTTPPAEAEDVTKAADETPAAPTETPEAPTAPAEDVVKSEEPKAKGKGKKGKVAKAASMTLVYDKSGNAIGVIDPSALTAVDGGGAPGDDTVQAAAADPATDPSAPLSQAAVAGDDAGATDRVIPGTATVQAPVQKDGKKKKTPKADKVKKGEQSAPTDIAAVLKELLTPFAEEIRKTQDLAGAVQQLEERITKFGKQPDDRNSAYLNGATGTPGVAHRDGADADPYVDLRKAAAEARTQSDVIKSSKDLAFAQIKDALSGSGSRHFEDVTDRFTNL